MMSAQADEEFMLLALEQGRLALEQNEVPIGAVAVIDGKVIAQAYNLVESRKSVTFHAELQLLKQLETRKGDWRMSDVTVYVTKEPCPMCTGALLLARVKKIVYAVDDDRYHVCRSLAEHSSGLWHPEVVSGVLADAALAQLQEFFRQRRQKN